LFEQLSDEYFTGLYAGYVMSIEATLKYPIRQHMWSEVQSALCVNHSKPFEIQVSGWCMALTGHLWRHGIEVLACARDDSRSHYFRKRGHSGTEIAQPERPSGSSRITRSTQVVFDLSIEGLEYPKPCLAMD